MSRVKTLHTASQYEMFLLALRSCHLGPYWFTTWNLEFELSKERVMACWGVLFILAKLVVLEFLCTLIPGRHGLCSLECMDYSQSWTTRPCGKYQHWSSSKRVMKMALVSNNPWWPSSSFWCFLDEMLVLLNNCVTGCFTPRLDLVVVGPDWFLASSLTSKPSSIILYNHTWIFQVCKICAFLPKKPTKRIQKEEILHIWKIQVFLLDSESPSP